MTNEPVQNELTREQHLFQQLMVLEPGNQQLWEAYMSMMDTSTSTAMVDFAGTFNTLGNSTDRSFVNSSAPITKFQEYIAASPEVFGDPQTLAISAGITTFSRRYDMIFMTWSQSSGAEGHTQYIFIDKHGKQLFSLSPEGKKVRLDLSTLQITSETASTGLAEIFNGDHTITTLHNTQAEAIIAERTEAALVQQPGIHGRVLNPALLKNHAQKEANFQEKTKRIADAKKRAEQQRHFDAIDAWLLSLEIIGTQYFPFIANLTRSFRSTLQEKAEKNKLAENYSIVTFFHELATSSNGGLESIYLQIPGEHQGAITSLHFLIKTDKVADKDGSTTPAAICWGSTKNDTVIPLYRFMGHLSTAYPDRRNLLIAALRDNNPLAFQLFNQPGRKAYIDQALYVLLTKATSINLSNPTADKTSLQPIIDRFFSPDEQRSIQRSLQNQVQ